MAPSERLLLGPGTSHVLAAGDGAHFIALDGKRLRLAADGSARFATHLFASAVKGVVPLDRGWLFLTADCALWRTEGFLDPPTYVDTVPGAYAMRGHGVGAVVTARGELFRTSGNAPVRVEGPERKRIIDAAFLGSQVLVVVDEHEQAHISQNGGADWLPLQSLQEPDGLDLGLDLVLDAQGARVLLRGMFARVAWPRETPAAFALVGDPLRPAPLGPASRAIEQWLQPVRPFHEDHAFVHSVDGSPRPIEGLPEHCSVLDPHRLYFCAGPQNRFVVVDPEGRARIVGAAPPLPEPQENMRASIDARSIVYLDQGCRGADEHICIVDTTTRRTRDVELYPAGADSFIGAQGDLVVFEGSGDSLARVVRGGAVHDVPAPVHLRRTTLRDRTLTIDSWISATVLRSSDDEPPDVLGLLINPRNDSVVEISLPEGAMAVGFRDRWHGVAAGADLAHLWVTDDGGASWRPIRPAFVGNPEAAPLVGRDPYECLVALESHHPRHSRVFDRLSEQGITHAEDCRARYDDRWLRCDVRGCTVHERLWVGDARVQAPSFTLVAAPESPFASLPRNEP